MTFVDFDILQSNCIIANVITFDFDLVFQGKYFICQYIGNGESLSKTAGDNICRFQHLLSNDIIANVILFDLDLLFEGQTSNVNISKTVKAGAKLHEVTFKDFNICHRIRRKHL